MALIRRRVSDPTTLKVLAHPLRVALLDLLVAEGPLTATEAAGRVASTPSNCSWHLRVLAQHGFVRETRGATGRHRPWRAVSEALTWADADPAGLAAEHGVVDDALVDLRLEQEAQRLRAARAQSGGAEGWRSVGVPVSARAWLTAAEAQEVAAQIAAVVARYAERHERPQERPVGSRPTAVVSWLVPTGPGRDDAGVRPPEDAAGSPAGPR